MNDSKKLKVVVFGGGRGATSILEALVTHPQVTVTALLNAYDDGLSTGRLRAYIPGMLGPSDIRKNIGTLMPASEACDQAMKRLLDFRFPEGTTCEDAWASLGSFANGAGQPADNRLAELQESLSIRQSRGIASYLTSFRSYETAEHASGQAFDYGDCSIGNLMFAGCYLRCGRDFNGAIADFSSFCRVRGKVLNVTDGRNYVLVAIKADGSFVPNEAQIVAPQSSSPVSEIFLLERYCNPAEELAIQEMDPADRMQHLHRLACYPQPNPQALDSIAAADLIIYGPGTQHSSLFPSYHTRGIAQAIAENKAAEKVFVGNIVHDHDIANATVQALISLFVSNMRRAATMPLDAGTLITKLFVQEPDRKNQNRPVSGTYIPFDPASLAMQQGGIRARDWEADTGRHAGGQIVDEILGIAKNLLSVRIEPLRHMISIVVPVLNEARTIGQVLSELEALDLTSHDIRKEIIVVDGGSTDGSLDIAREHKAVRVYSLGDERGRGAAFRLGVEQARGNLVVLFPADGEYSCVDILTVATPIIDNKFNAVFGSRAVKCVNLGERIRSIYGNRQADYLVSKYGGMALSIASLFLYNRYVTDPLSTLKAYDKSLLVSLNLDSQGVDLECEILGKIARREEYILEVPVQYFPRTKEQGKKIRFWDGVQALAALVRYRFSRVSSRSI